MLVIYVCEATIRCKRYRESGPDVYKLIREGVIKGYKDKDRVRVYADSLVEYLKTLHLVDDDHPRR